MSGPSVWLSQSAFGQPDLRQIASNAIFATSADTNLALFQGGSGGGEESAVRSNSGDRVRFWRVLSKCQL